MENHLSNKENNLQARFRSFEADAGEELLDRRWEEIRMFLPPKKTRRRRVLFWLFPLAGIFPLLWVLLNSSPGENERGGVIVVDRGREEARAPRSGAQPSPGSGMEGKALPGPRQIHAGHTSPEAYSGSPAFRSGETHRVPKDFPAEISFSGNGMATTSALPETAIAEVPAVLTPFLFWTEKESLHLAVPALATVPAAHPLRSGRVLAYASVAPGAVRYPVPAPGEALSSFVYPGHAPAGFWPSLQAGIGLMGWIDDRMFLSGELVSLRGGWKSEGTVSRGAYGPDAVQETISITGSHRDTLSAYLPVDVTESLSSRLLLSIAGGGGLTLGSWRGVEADAFAFLRLTRASFSRQYRFTVIGDSVRFEKKGFPLPVKPLDVEEGALTRNYWIGSLQTGFSFRKKIGQGFSVFLRPSAILDLTRAGKKEPARVSALRLDLGVALRLR